MPAQKASMAASCSTTQQAGRRSSISPLPPPPPSTRLAFALRGWGVALRRAATAGIELCRGRAKAQAGYGCQRPLLTRNACGAGGLTAGASACSARHRPQGGFRSGRWPAGSHALQQAPGDPGSTHGAGGKARRSQSRAAQRAPYLAVLAHAQQIRTMDLSTCVSNTGSAFARQAVPGSSPC